MSAPGSLFQRTAVPLPQLAHDLACLYYAGSVTTSPETIDHGTGPEVNSVGLWPESVAATGGDAVPAFFEAQPVTPPFYCATWETAQALEMFAALETPLPLGAMVHVSSDMVWARPLPPADPIRCRVELDRVERTPRGLKLTVLSRNWMGAGQLCSQGTSVFMVRTRTPNDGESPRPRPTAAPAPNEGGWTELARWPLAAGAGRRYARVSGDYNPIHLWPWTARPFGFRAPILHGYALAARTAHTLIAQHLRGAFAAVRVSFTWFGVRKTLTPQQQKHLAMCRDAATRIETLDSVAFAALRTDSEGFVVEGELRDAGRLQGSAVVRGVVAGGGVEGDAGGPVGTATGPARARSAGSSAPPSGSRAARSCLRST